MWNLSSLAQRAKDAAAQIEHQINDSIGLEESGSPVSPASNPDQQEESEAGYLNVEEECVSFSEATDDDVDRPISTRLHIESAPNTGEISFVDLKSALPQSYDGSAADALEEALVRIDLLEQQVKSLEEQLMSAKDESEKYYSSNIELMEQVRELRDENDLLKENSPRKENE